MIRWARCYQGTAAWVRPCVMKPTISAHLPRCVAHRTANQSLINHNIYSNQLPQLRMYRWVQAHLRDVQCRTEGCAVYNDYN